MALLTIFTPTYNRAHTLPRLYESLQKQTLFDFEWLVVDDGSSDGTQKLFEKWLNEDNKFSIRYYSVENGGKNRAINKGLLSAHGEYFLILDSDDMLTSDAVEFYCMELNKTKTVDNLIGISGKKADIKTGLPVGYTKSSYDDSGYVECNNLERKQHGLVRDMAEVFKIDILKRYHFDVWPGEKFTPEEVVWNQIALDGYSLRWYNKITYICEYQEGGLTNSAWSLLKRNPMGYATMWNHRLLYTSGIRTRMNAVVQYTACCILAKEWKEISRCKAKILMLALLPVSILLSFRRKKQLKS